MSLSLSPGTPYVVTFVVSFVVMLIFLILSPLEVDFISNVFFVTLFPKLTLGSSTSNSVCERISCEESNKIV